ncbi:hypothetical protein Godav_021048 [Gossypium davidsonii]|uniref:Uncharacterized protein n=1 Tax=Gossypium davidsonii TaxID=34287 RepID=A0A7J8R4Z6_GOSDV|nr:hypothetical protein [Gossypium davidsonii]
MGMNTNKRVDVFALSIYGLVIFHKALGHIDEAISDLFDWLDKRVPLLEIWGAIGYAHLLVLRQFISVMQGLAQWEFAYKGDNYKKKYRCHNSAIELKVSLNKIEELKGKIEELETALQNCELRVEPLKTNNEYWKEQLQHFQGQIWDRDHIMGEAVTPVREVADHLQTLLVQADMLSLKYESESDQGRELAWLIRKVKALNIRARPYM